MIHFLVLDSVKYFNHFRTVADADIDPSRLFADFSLNRLSVIHGFIVLELHIVLSAQVVKQPLLFFYSQLFELFAVKIKRVILQIVCV